jgi:hypothetical protein
MSPKNSTGLSTCNTAGAVAGSENFIDRVRQMSVMAGTTLDPAAAEDIIADVTQALNRI